MHRPHRSRNIGLAFAASGIVLGIIHLQLPPELVHERLLGFILILYWPNAVLFGGGHALFSHFKVRKEQALARGEDVIARWRVDAATWRAFIAHNTMLNQEDGAVFNELSIREEVPASGINVIIGETAIAIDGSIHTLPRRGTPEITHAELNISRVRPSFVELHLYYPGGGTGASGVPHAPMRTLLRFPVPADALREADRVVAHYRGDLPATQQPDFFHGRGDGSNPEDLSTCLACGYQTHKYLSHCPQCGGSMLSKRWSRRFGWALFACGLFITSLMGAVIFYNAPLMLRPDVSINGTRFTGTLTQGVIYLGIFGVVFLFGITAMLYGLWQIKTGRRSKAVIFGIIGLAGLLLLIALATAWI